MSPTRARPPPARPPRLSQSQGQRVVHSGRSRNTLRGGSGGRRRGFAAERLRCVSSGGVVGGAVRGAGRVLTQARVCALPTRTPSLSFGALPRITGLREPPFLQRTELADRPSCACPACARQQPTSPQRGSPRPCPSAGGRALRGATLAQGGPQWAGPFSLRPLGWGGPLVRSSAGASLLSCCQGFPFVSLSTCRSPPGVSTDATEAS